MPVPLIGLTTYNGKNQYGLPIAALVHMYISALAAAGGAPVLIPSGLGENGQQVLLNRLDGILFTGGGDIALGRFNGKPHPRVDNVDPERDALELSLLLEATRSGKPFLGICRGFQVVNVAFGGTLYTHIEDQKSEALKHDYYPEWPRDYLAHEVRIGDGARLAGILGAARFQVNSLHHQGVKDVAPGLLPAAHAPDGLVEALELPGHPFGLAVQWHPEWLTEHEHARRLFRAFVEAAGKHG